MQVRVEDVSPVEKKLIVEIPWATVNNKLTSAYRELSRSVQLRGFRKGKVPRSVLQRMYGKHVHSEVTNQLVRESFVNATVEHKIQAISEPRLETTPSIKKGEPFSFEAIIEVKGEVIPENYDGMELKVRRLEVADAAVNSTLESLRRENTELLPIDGRDVTARTDVVTLKLTGTIGEQEVDQPHLHVDLSEPEREPLPGLIDALLGLPLDVEDHAITLELPAGPDESQPAETAELVVSILDARKKEIPELDDEFAKDLDRGETLEELRQSVIAELEEREKEVIRRETREAALKELVKRNQIPVASAFVERGIQLQHERTQAMLEMLGAQDHNRELTDEMRERMRPAAIEEVRGELLLEAIAQKENIEVTEEEVDERVAEIAKSRKTPMARLRAEFDRDGQLENIRFQIRRDKTLDLLVDRATLTEYDPAEEAEAAADADAAAAGADAADDVTSAEAESGSETAETDGPDESA